MTQKQICLTIAAVALSFVMGLVAGAVILRTPTSDLQNRISTLEAEIQATKSEHTHQLRDATEKIGHLQSVANNETQKRKQIDSAIALQQQQKESAAQAAAAKARTDKKQLERKLAVENTREIARMEEHIQKMISVGVIHSVNADLNQVRIDPTAWSLLDLETKQNIVTFFSAYFDMKDSTGRVTILSNRNDSKLATYSSWSGIKIIQ